MLTSLFLKLRRRHELADDEKAALDAAVSEVRTYRPHEIITPEGVLLSNSNLLVEGLVCRFKDLRDGRRQILELNVPGDFIDLHSFLLKRLEHNISALTPVKIAIVPHANLTTITEQWPHLARMLWFSTLLDAAINREWLLAIGRRSAVGRLAHLFCELDVRLDVVGLVTDDHYALPLTQTDIADATGLTPVHVNRMLRELRDGGLMTFRGGMVQISDRAGLREVAEFDPTYLYLDELPR